MNDGVERQRQPGFAHQPGSDFLAGMRALQPADPLGPTLLGILHGKLDMIEPGRAQRRHQRRIQQHPGGDEVCVGARPDAPPR